MHFKNNKTPKIQHIDVCIVDEYADCKSFQDISNRAF